MKITKCEHRGFTINNDELRRKRINNNQGFLEVSKTNTNGGGKNAK